MSSPALRFRDNGDMHVAIRSPTPASPAKVSGCAPAATPRRVISARPRVMIPALAESPKPSPSTVPAASATTFFSAPASSTPIEIGVRVHPEPIGRQDRCELRRQLAVLRRNDRSGRLARRDLARQVRSRQRRDPPSGKLLRDNLAHAQVRALLDALHDAEHGRIGEEHRSESPQGAAQVCRWRGGHEEAVWLGEVGVIGHDAKVGREDDAGEVPLVRALVRQLLRRLARVGPEADRPLRVGEEHGKGGSPGAGADDADLIGHVARISAVIGRSGDSHVRFTARSRNDGRLVSVKDHDHATTAE